MPIFLHQKKYFHYHLFSHYVNSMSLQKNMFDAYKKKQILRVSKKTYFTSLQKIIFHKSPRTQHNSIIDIIIVSTGNLKNALIID